MKRLLKLSFIVLLLFSCTSRQNKQIPDTIKLGYIPYSADLPLFVAIDKGYFKKNGLNVIPVESKNSSEALDLVLTGKTNGAMGNSFSTLFSIYSKDSNKIKLVNVSSEMEEGNRFISYILVNNKSTINSIDQLKGKVIGTGKGTSQLLWVKLYLLEQGIDPVKDITIMQESPENLLDGLKTNQYNAIFIFEPYGTIAISNKIGKVFKPFFRKNIINPFPAGGATLSVDFIQKYPMAAKLIIESLDKAIEFINRNPQEAKKSLIKYTPIDSVIALNSNIYYWWPSSDIKEKQIQDLADILFKNRIIKKHINVKNLIYFKNGK